MDTTHKPRGLKCRRRPPLCRMVSMPMVHRGTIPTFEKEGFPRGRHSVGRDSKYRENILFALYAALMSMTLKHVFNHSDDFVKIPATHCFTSGQVKAMKILMPKIQGKTKKQQNPFPVGSLPWMAWGIARFGCWDCYSYKPGYTTFKSGLDKFAQMHIMYEAMKDVYNG